MKRIILLLLVLTFTVSFLFASGSNARSSGGSGDPVPISVFMDNYNRPWVPDLANHQEIMRRTNTIIDAVPGASPEAINLLFASGDLPDIIEINSMNFLNYMNTSYLRPLDELLKTHGPNIMEHTSPGAWNLVTVQGRIHALPYENLRIKRYTYARSDWLANLGIDLSKNQDYTYFGGKVVTLNEFRDILVQFTRNDPTRTGSKTYGLGGIEKKDNLRWSKIFGAFGGTSGYYYIESNRVMPWVVTDQYRDALQYINSLWREGVIDPEIYLMSNDQAKQKMINSVSGAGTGEWWNAAYTILADGLLASRPEADFIPLRITSNDGRISGAADNGSISHTKVITTMSKNPEKAMELLDFLCTYDGWALTRLGVEGLDYNMVNGFPDRTERGFNLVNANSQLEFLYNLSNRIDLVQAVLDRKPVNTPMELLRQKWSLLDDEDTYWESVYESVFYGLPNPRAFDEYGVDVNNWIEQSAMAFITGETPINDVTWNNYINTWKRMGGVRILQGYIDTYNTLKGTRVTAGITE